MRATMINKNSAQLPQKHEILGYVRFHMLCLLTKCDKNFEAIRTNWTGLKWGEMRINIYINAHILFHMVHSFPAPFYVQLDARPAVIRPHQPRAAPAASALVIRDARCCRRRPPPLASGTLPRRPTRCPGAQGTRVPIPCLWRRGHRTTTPSWPSSV